MSSSTPPTPPVPSPIDIWKQRLAQRDMGQIFDVHVGLSPNDNALWNFAFSLEPNKEVIKRMSRTLDTFFDLFSAAWKPRVGNNPLFKQFFWVMKHEQAGSVRNGTHLDGCDFDVLVVINSEAESAIGVNRQASTPSFAWKVDSKDEINRGEVHTLATIFVNAVINFCEAQDKTFEWTEPGSEQKLRFTFKANTPHGELEFDVLPVLRGNDGHYYLLNSKDGTLVSTRNDLAAKEMERLTSDFKDWNNFVRVLKFVAKKEAERSPDLKAAKLPSCTFETAAINWANRPLPETAWKKNSFSAIFHDCLKIIQESLNDEGKRLPPPNDYSSDVLSKIRQGKQHKVAVNSFLEKWLAVPEEELHQKLLDLKDLK